MPSLTRSLYPFDVEGSERRATFSRGDAICVGQMAVPGVKMQEQQRKDMIASDSSLPGRATDRGNQAMTPLDPDYAARVQTSFSRQQAMTLLDAEMLEVLPA